MKALKLKKILAVAVAAVGLAAVAASTVTIDKIEDGDVWSTKKVTYTVADVPEPGDTYTYTLAFDVTAYSVTTNIKMGIAKNGTFTYTLDTAAIFGETRKDPKAKFRVSLEKGKVMPPVQLWENGPYFSQCNVGASSPEESGYYFWWGDTVGYVRNGESWDAANGSATGFEFVFGSNCPTGGKYIYQLYNDGNGYIDADSEDGKLRPKYDAARAHLGGSWRMPTKAELDALKANCTPEWTTDWNGTGKAGCIVKGKGAYASKSIFLPAAGFGDGAKLLQSGSVGHYWSSSPSTAIYYACDFIFYYSSEPETTNTSVKDFERCCGCTVRAVRSSAE